MYHKQIISALFAVITAISIISFNADAAEVSVHKAYLKLDVNSDRMVDAADATAVLSDYVQVSTGHNSSFSGTIRFVADFNNNGTIDAADATGILSLYAHNSVTRNEDNYSLVTFEVEYFFNRTESDTFHANSYEECLEFIANDKKTRSLQSPGYYKVYYNEYIFGKVYDSVRKVVITDQAP